MSRSLKKGPYINERLVQKLKRLRPGDKTMVKTWCRACVITPDMVGYTIGVYNGRIHVAVKVVENMVGHRLGEFSPTRKFVVHGGRMAKEQAAAKAASEAAARAAATATATTVEAKPK